MRLNRADHYLDNYQTALLGYTKDSRPIPQGLQSKVVVKCHLQPQILYCTEHRRRIKTDEQTKVVTAVWGTELTCRTTVAISHQDDLKKRINRISSAWRNGCFGKLMIIRFTPYQTTTRPKMSQKLLFKSYLLLNGQCDSQVLVRSPNNSDDLCLLFCLYPSSTVYLDMH